MNKLIKRDSGGVVYSINGNMNADASRVLAGIPAQEEAMLRSSKQKQEEIKKNQEIFKQKQKEAAIKEAAKGSQAAAIGAGIGTAIGGAFQAFNKTSDADTKDKGMTSILNGLGQIFSTKSDSQLANDLITLDKIKKKKETTTTLAKGGQINRNRYFMVYIRKKAEQAGHISDEAIARYINTIGMEGIAKLQEEYNQTLPKKAAFGIKLNYVLQLKSVRR